MQLNQTVAAVVTGGASGLDEATARALAARGVKPGDAASAPLTVLRQSL